MIPSARKKPLKSKCEMLSMSQTLGIFLFLADGSTTRTSMLTSGNPSDWARAIMEMSLRPTVLGEPPVNSEIKSLWVICRVEALAT